MFFPKNKSYGLASVAGNADKISALEHEFEIVRKRMDAEAKKGYKLHDQLPYLHKTCLMVCNSAHLWMPATALKKKEGQSIGYYTKNQASIQFKELQHHC
jgi:hypothetical protein